MMGAALLICLSLVCLSQADPLRDVLADYDAELRRADGRVDVDGMVERLKELGVNTYFWLIWHAPTDWDDLKLFLPKAAEAGINVWVYLVPPSESPPHTKLFSEPFRLDYLRWAEEIAKLSLKHPNLKAWVIDDFYYNRSFFTPDYVKRMQERAEKINPSLAFLPLMYFRQITPRFVKDYGGLIDGVVVAYPQSREEIERARETLGDMPFIVMTAGQESQFRKRHGDPATPERIAEWLEMCLRAWRDGRCDGVVTYCLDKRRGSPVFDLAKELFDRFKGDRGGGGGR